MAAEESLLIELARNGIPVIGALGGAFLGAFISGNTQRKLFTEQKHWEEKKEKKEHLESVLKIYNSVIKLDGEHMVVESIDGGRLYEFNAKLYSTLFRPVIFENFHLISQRVADTVLEIDDTLRRCDINEGIEDEEHKELIQLFDKLIELIKKELNDFRTQYVK